MFKCIIRDGSVSKQFVSVMNCLSYIVDEIKLQCDSEGIRGTALDRSHITFISFDFRYSFFDEFLCDVPETLNIDTDELVKVLKRLKKDDVLTLSSDEGNLILTFTGESTRTFKIRLVDSEYDTPDKPELEFPVKDLSLPFKVFQDASKDIGICSDKLNLKVTSDKVFISGAGNFGTVNNEYSVDPFSFNTNRDMLKSTFSIEKLNDFFRMDKVSSDVLISMGEDMPLFLCLDDGDCCSEFLLAPRIESSD